MKTIDLAIILLLFIILLGSVFIAFYYFKNIENQCLSSPLTYGAKQIEKDYGYSFVGTAYLLTPPGVKSPLFIFDATSLNVN